MGLPHRCGPCSTRRIADRPYLQNSLEKEAVQVVLVRNFDGGRGAIAWPTVRRCAVTAADRPRPFGHDLRLSRNHPPSRREGPDQLAPTGEGCAMVGQNGEGALNE